MRESQAYHGFLSMFVIHRLARTSYKKIVWYVNRNGNLRNPFDDDRPRALRYDSSRRQGRKWERYQQP